jgi:hypothetical protein
VLCVALMLTTWPGAGAFELLPGEGPTNGWQEHAIEVAAPVPGNRLVIVYVPLTGGPGTVYVDDVEFSYLDARP